MRSEYGKVLIVQTAFLGDLILTIPLFKMARERFEGAEIYALVKKPYAPFLHETGVVDGVIPFDKRGEEKGVSSLFRKARELRRMGFDIAISPHTSFRTGLLLYLSDIRERVGFKSASLSFLYTNVTEKRGYPYEYMRILSILEGIGHRIDFNGYRPYLEIREEWRGKGVDFLRRKGVVDGQARKVVGIFPGSVWRTKEWGEERFGVVAVSLEKRGLRVVILGGEEDRGKGESIRRMGGKGVTNLCGETSLSDLLHISTCLDLFICNDSGPLHLASILNRPVLGIFGPTIPSLGFAPFSEISDTVGVELYCRPCGTHGHKRCPEKHHRCMKEIAPDLVIQKALELIERL